MGKLRCQLCGSTNIEKKSEQKFSVGKGILGTLFFGSGGAVAGVNGKNEEYYYCNACCQRTIPLIGTISNRIDELLANPKGHEDELLELVKKYYNIEYNPSNTFEKDSSYNDSSSWGKTIMEVLKSYKHESFTSSELFRKIEKELNVTLPDMMPIEQSLFVFFKNYPYIICETRDGTKYFKVSDNWNLDDYYFTYEKDEKVNKLPIHRFNRKKIENNGIDFLKDIINNAANFTSDSYLKKYLVLEWNIEEDKCRELLTRLQKIGILNDDYKPDNKEKISEYILNNELELIKVNGKDIIKNYAEFLNDFIDIIDSNKKYNQPLYVFYKLADKWSISEDEFFNIKANLKIFDICDCVMLERKWKIINLDNIKDCYIDENKNLARKNDNRKEITSNNSYDFFKTIEEYINLNENTTMFDFVGKKWLINYKDFENLQQSLENAGILVLDSDNHKWNIYMDKIDDYYIDKDKKLKKGQKQI